MRPVSRGEQHRSIALERRSRLEILLQGLQPRFPQQGAEIIDDRAFRKKTDLRRILTNLRAKRRPGDVGVSVLVARDRGISRLLSGGRTVLILNRGSLTRCQNQYRCRDQKPFEGDHIVTCSVYRS